MCDYVHMQNGPRYFTSGNKFRMESPGGQFGPTSSQKHEPSAKSFDNGLKSPPSSRSFSSSNTNSPTLSMPMASHPESRTSSIKGIFITFILELYDH